LVLLGSGNGREELERYVSVNGIEGIVFAGFQQIDVLPRWYAGAGAFVHAALTEPWGLVVNEAMASGLPVIVSERCGCAQDLVQDGVNGFLFDPEKTEVLAGLMTKVAAPDFPREAFGEASRRIIAKWGPERFAAGLQAAAQAAMQAGARRLGWLDRVLLEILSRR
jgi:glycosyltransferase involved in cell wall biosynthesis